MNADDQPADRPDPPKTRSSPEFLSLSRCAACYNHRHARSRWGGDGESSSSAEDSGPEADPESEAESTSSSSSSSSDGGSSMEASPAASGDADEPESVVKDANGREEPPPDSREDKTMPDGPTKRAPLVRSSSLPGSLTHLLPRPHTVVSTLRLQVLPQNHHHDHHDALCIVRQHPSEGGEGGPEGTGDPPLPPPAGLPWQQRSQPTLLPHQLSHQHQHRHLPPLSAPGQRLPPPLHTHPVLPPPDAALHALSAQQCWFCYNMQFPFSPYWSFYGNRRQPR